MVIIQPLPENIPGSSTDFGNLRVGDSVTVRWNKKEGKESQFYNYGREGVVVQITEKFVTIRSPSGYKFCVGIHHLRSGALLKKAG
ncbi:MAG: hypothetical protein HPY58_14235 [Firmicutes bacterium]|nr:hypothetical protein [Bacillota bacterium]